MAPTNITDPYACSSFPTLDGATKAPPAYWPPTLNSTSGQRACVAFPNYYMVECCGTASQAVHDPKCGWEVCISTTTDAQWEECFKKLDAQRGNVANKGYTYNCAQQATKESSKVDNKKSGARRAVVGAAVVGAACAALAVL